MLCACRRAPFAASVLRRAAAAAAERAKATEADATNAARMAGRIVPEGYTVLREGKGEVLQRENDVFYNKAQVVNRDLSIAVLRLFERRRREEAEAGVGPKPWRLRHSGLGAMDLHSPLAPLLIPEETLAVLRESVANANAEAEADEPWPEEEEGGAEGDADAEAQPEGEEGAEAAEGDAAAADGDAGAGEEGEAEPAARKPQPPPGPLRILEGLSATGLRAFRYALEVPNVGVVVANDLDPVAAAAIRRNKAFGGPGVDAVHAHQGDARVVMLTHEKLFDVVDLDPYGTPCALLDSGVQAVAEGGLLCVTATDMAVLCGNASEVCWTKYGSYPIKIKACHEIALRTLLASIQAAAVRHRRHIVPMLSVSIDFYIRVFVRVYTSPSAAKESASKHSYVYLCTGCESRTLQPLGRISERASGSKRFTPGGGPTVGSTCEHCGGKHVMGGPIWSDPIHDFAAVKDLRAMLAADRAAFPAYDKVHALLTTVEEELPDVPLYESMHGLASTLKCTPPPAVLMRSALINAGYRVSSTHASPLGLKTDAPMKAVWDVLRCWVREHPVKARETETPGSRILAQAPELEANFARARGAFSKAQEEHVKRYSANPEPNWGPKMRHGRVAPDAPPPKKARGEEKE